MLAVARGGRSRIVPGVVLGARHDRARRSPAFADRCACARNDVMPADRRSPRHRSAARSSRCVIAGAIGATLWWMLHPPRVATCSRSRRRPSASSSEWSAASIVVFSPEIDSRAHDGAGRQARARRTLGAARALRHRGAVHAAAGRRDGRSKSAPRSTRSARPKRSPTKVTSRFAPRRSRRARPNRRCSTSPSAKRPTSSFWARSAKASIAARRSAARSRRSPPTQNAMC